MFADRTNWSLNRNRLSQELLRHREERRPLVDLTVSNPAECGFHFDEQVLLHALCTPGALRYDPDAKGLHLARKAVAKYYAERGDEVSPDDIVLTTSTSEAYSFIFRTICNPGDEILIPEPSYPLFAFLADIQDVKIVRYRLLYDYGWQTDFHGLEKVITAKTRGVIVVQPNNPTGHFCKREERARLNEICRAREIAVIADEVFLDYTISEKATASFAANAEALTFTMSGLSKIAGLPQMKMAWLIASGPPELKSPALSRLEIIADTYLSLNTPVQQATDVFLEQRHKFQDQLKSRVLRNLAELDRQLALQTLCRRLEVEGGWYVVLRVPALRQDEDVAIELLASRNVYIHPGHFYDFQTEGHLVASLITPEAEFAEGIFRLLSIFEDG